MVLYKERAEARSEPVAKEYAAADFSLKLKESASSAGTILCMGLDPVPEFLPEEFQWDIEREADSGCRRLGEFFYMMFKALSERGLKPAAFKPNIGYFHVLDRPRNGSFGGSQALVTVLELLNDMFPGIPVILDAKRGDIARSSRNYAEEAFDLWKCDAVTVSPYMGSDSVSPFFHEGKGVYILNRTSNPGGADIQNAVCGESRLFQIAAERIGEWHDLHEGVGAVVGATYPEELSILARMYAKQEVPLLIPGVGSQGGSGAETLRLLKDAGYPLPLARINSSSGLTHPWKSTRAPENWLDTVLRAVDTLAEELSIS
jgi:orotidine-5'-phosphate decarboxylase